MQLESIPLKSLSPPLLTGDCIETKRAELAAYFENSWALYESLFAQINSDEAFFIKAEPLRHPLIFYFGHTATFYINKFVLGKHIDQRINPALEAICAVGVDEMSWDDLDSSNYQWPSVNEVREYRSKVYTLVKNMIKTMPLKLPITQDSIAWVILMGIEHERIHLETSSVIIRMLDLSYLTANENWQACTLHGEAPNNEFLKQDATSITLGKTASDQTYGWDNEYGSENHSLEEFEVSKYLVSNGEFLKFVEAGGYQEKSYWTEEGQAWLSYRHPKHPRFWSLKEDQYFQRNLNSEMPLPLDWPVDVNYLEAKAFCNWMSQAHGKIIRLPTEAEWCHLRSHVDGDLPNWQTAPGNTNLDHFASSCPVNKYQHNGIFDIIGNVWQWTETPIDGYSPFNVHPLYDDFSTPTFDGKHNLIKGGSWISTGNEACKNSRYAFRRHFFQHAGFRYIKSAKEAPKPDIKVIEQDASIANELHRHYQFSNKDNNDGLSQAIALIKENFKEIENLKALDLGCSVGRATIELSKYFDHVDGIDFTARHIQHALALKEGKTVRYALPLEGEIVDYLEIALEELNYSSLENINFYQGDALNLKPQFTHYDFIYCGHLIESLYSPKDFLAIVHERLNLNGILAISSNYDWVTENKDKQLGGFKVNGENFSNTDGLHQLLKTHFELLETKEFEWKKRVNSRKSELLNSEITIWRRVK